MKLINIGESGAELFCDPETVVYVADKSNVRGDRCEVCMGTDSGLCFAEILTKGSVVSKRVNKHRENKSKVGFGKP